MVFLIRTAEIRCRNRVDNLIAINHQFRLSVTIATELYLLPFFCALIHLHVPFLGAIHIQKFDSMIKGVI